MAGSRPVSVRRSFHDRAGTCRAGGRRRPRPRAPLPPAVVLVSLLAGVVIFLIGEQRAATADHPQPDRRVAKIALVVWIGTLVAAGHEPIFRLDFVPGFQLVLRADPLSMLFAGLSSGLWLVTTVYAIAYLERSPEPRALLRLLQHLRHRHHGHRHGGQPAHVLRVLRAAHARDLAAGGAQRHAAALRGGRTYLRYTLIGSAVFLVGLIWLYGLAGSRTSSPAARWASWVSTPRGSCAPSSCCSRSAWA
jgi:multicomponent Na+:H+ antiporter subunit D